MAIVPVVVENEYHYLEISYKDIQNSTRYKQIIDKIIKQIERNE